MTEQPTIPVKGVGHVSLPPDMTVITFRTSALDLCAIQSCCSLH